MVDPLRTEPPPPPPPPPPEKPGERQHTVREGETLQGIAEDHHTTLQAILDENPQVRDANLINTGEVLRMPDVTVAPDVSRTVDAVLSPGATAEQRNEAYARVQDHVDAAGGIGATGVAREALPREAVQLLGDAGLPTVDPEVIESVDQVIGPDATFEQRIAGYESVAAYVDRVGGVSDQGITAEALPAKANELLRADGTDVRFRPEVITAVNGLLKGGASLADREAAYSTVQRYVDQVGGVGDAGIVADALPGKAAQLLADADNPALRFEPQVMQAVDTVIGPTGNDADKLAGYQALQQYVDRVGGISDQGITAEYLPSKAAELLRERGIDVELQTAPNASVDEVVRIMEAGATPAEQLQILDQAYAQADAQKRSELLADPQVQQAIRSAAFDAVEPLSQEPDGSAGQAVPFLDAANNLDALTRDLDPALVAAVLEQTTSQYQSYVLNDYGGPTGIEGTATFLRVLDRAAGTPDGDAVISDLADTGLALDRNGVYQHISSGGTPAFATQSGARNDVVDGVNTYAGSTVKDSVDAYLQHTQELNWLVSNQGGVMTPEQLQQATQDYISRQSGDWETTANELKEQVAQDGLKLQTQIETMLAAGGYESEVEALLADPNNQFALTTAFGNHPEAVTDRTLSLMSGLGKTTESGRRVLEIAANAYIKAQVVQPLSGYDPANPRSVAQVQSAINRLTSPGMSTALGIDQAKLNQAVQSLEGSLRGPNATQADLDQALNRLNSDLDGAALSKTTPAGQLFRALGVGLAGINLASSLQRAGRDPAALENWGKVVTDTLGVSQKTAEIMFARGAGGTVTETLASRTAGRVVSGLSAAADGWLAASSFAKGDVALGTLYSAAAAGGALATAASLGWVGAWGGPVGIGITAIAALGVYAVQSTRDSNVHMDDPDTAPFLEFANLKPETAKALTDQSGDGHSPVPVLQKYAEYKGYDLSNPAHQQAFVDWLNNLPPETLSDLRDGLHHKLDDWGGDAEQLGSSTDRPQTEYDVNPSTGSATPRITVFEPGTVGEIDAFLMQRGSYAGGSVLQAPPA
jgi:hypothetical protein